MTKICFCGISGNGMSPLAQIMSLKGAKFTAATATSTPAATAKTVRRCLT